MTISQILETKPKKMSATDKIVAISSVVANAREIYGNTELSITPAKSINTCNGQIPLAYISNEDKLAVVAQEVQTIKIKAIEATQATEGTVFEQEVLKLIATNPVLSNLSPAIESKYI